MRPRNICWRAAFEKKWKSFPLNAWDTISLSAYAINFPDEGILTRRSRQHCRRVGMYSDSFCLLLRVSHFRCGWAFSRLPPSKVINGEGVKLCKGSACWKMQKSLQHNSRLESWQFSRAFSSFRGLVPRSFGMFAVPHYLCFANTHFSVSNFAFPTQPCTAIITAKCSFEDINNSPSSFPESLVPRLFLKIMRINLIFIEFWFNARFCHTAP